MLLDTLWLFTASCKSSTEICKIVKLSIWCETPNNFHSNFSVIFHTKGGLHWHWNRNIYTDILHSYGWARFKQAVSRDNIAQAWTELYVQQISNNSAFKSLLLTDFAVGAVDVCNLCRVPIVILEVSGSTQLRWMMKRTGCWKMSLKEQKNPSNQTKQNAEIMCIRGNTLITLAVYNAKNDDPLPLAT